MELRLKYRVVCRYEWYNNGEMVDYTEVFENKAGASTKDEYLRYLEHTNEEEYRNVIEEMENEGLEIVFGYRPYLDNRDYSGLDLEVPKINLSLPIISLSETFAGLKARSLDLSKLDVYNVVETSNCFIGAELDTIIGITKLNFSSLKTTCNMFKKVKLKELNLDNLSLPNVEDYYEMFIDAHIGRLSMNNLKVSCTNLHEIFTSLRGNELYCNNWEITNTESRTFDAGYIFRCNFEKVYFNYFKAGNNASLGNMFNECEIEELHICNWSLDSVNTMYNMFAEYSYIGTIYFYCSGCTTGRELYIGYSGHINEIYIDIDMVRDTDLLGFKTIYTNRIDYYERICNELAVLVEECEWKDDIPEVVLYDADTEVNRIINLFGAEVITGDIQREKYGTILIVDK